MKTHSHISLRPPSTALAVLCGALGCSHLTPSSMNERPTNSQQIFSTSQLLHQCPPLLPLLFSSSSSSSSFSSSSSSVTGLYAPEGLHGGYPLRYALNEESLHQFPRLFATLHCIAAPSHDSVSNDLSSSGGRVWVRKRYMHGDWLNRRGPLNDDLMKQVYSHSFHHPP